MEPVKFPFTDVLDLHTFHPREIPDLLSDYLSACIEGGIFSVRIIHGKGGGHLKHRVHGILKKNPMVASFQDAPPESGGWGATVVTLRREK